MRLSSLMLFRQSGGLCSYQTHCRKPFMSLPCCDRIRTRTHTHTLARTHTFTRRDCAFLLSYTHRNMHMVAPLFNLHMLQFKGIQVRWRSVLLFQLLASPTICSDVVRSGFYELHKGMVIRASEWRWAVWPLSLAAGVLSALMWIIRLNNFWEVEGATETLQRTKPPLYKWWLNLLFSFSLSLCFLSSILHLELHISHYISIMRFTPLTLQTISNMLPSSHCRPIVFSFPFFLEYLWVLLIKI